MSLKLRLCASLLLVTVLSAASAWWRAFTAMAPYDDDGTLMLPIQQFFDGQVLYDGLRTWYGPLYYAYQSIPHMLTGAPVSQDSVRMVAVVFWVAAGLVLFLLVYRVTGSLVLALAAHFVGFRALSFIGAEPAHPQELCILLLLAVPLAALARRGTALVWFGVLAACMALTKINLATLVVLALATVFALALPRGFPRWLLAPAAALCAVALPFTLMTAHLAQSWALRYALLVSLSLPPAILAAAACRIEPVSIRHLALAVAAAVLSATVISWFVLARGSTIGGMIDSLVLWPRAHFAQSWNFPLQIGPVAPIWAVACWIPAWLAFRGRLPQALAAVLKITLSALVVAGIAAHSFGALIGAATPMLWLAAIPNANPAQTSPGDLLRPLLAILGVLQVLYAYPVAGSQTAFATLLMVAAGALCLHDALAWLATLVPPAAARLAPRTAVALVAAGWAFTAAHAYANLQSREPLRLPGAQLVRLEPEGIDALRRLQAAAQPCSMLVSAPGLLSLNLLSGKPAPTVAHSAFSNNWMNFLNNSEQEAVVREVAAQPHPCVIYNPKILRLFTPGRQSNRPPPSAPPWESSLRSSPLMRYILDEYRTEFEAGGYRFMVRRSRP